LLKLKSTESMMLLYDYALPENANLVK